MTKSPPAPPAATAASTVPTCHATSASPERRARATISASGSLQNTSTTRNRAAASSNVGRSAAIQCPKKPMPTAPPPANASACVMRSLDDSRSNSHSIPSAPAEATAPASSGPATPPMAACCTGCRQPTSPVNVVSTAPMLGPAAVHRPLRLGNRLPLLPLFSAQSRIAAACLEGQLALQLAPRVDPPLADVACLDAGSDRATRLAAVRAVGEPAGARQLLHLGERTRQPVLGRTVQSDAAQPRCVDD